MISWLQPRSWLRRLLTESSGQDMVEYAIITVFFAIVIGYLIFVELGLTISSTYISWDDAMQGAWENPEPSAGAAS